MKTIYVDTTYVGKLIVTKMIGSDDYANMTDIYKYKSKLLFSFTFVIITVFTIF